MTKPAAAGDIDLSHGSESDVDDMQIGVTAEARMKIVTQYAREILLSHVKNDRNLTVYPGAIQIPSSLYAPRKSITPKKTYYESDEDAEKKTKKPKKSISHYVNKKDDDDERASDEGEESEEEMSADEKSKPDKEDGKELSKQKDLGLTYEPDEHSSAISPSQSPSFGNGNVDEDFGDVSPISKAADSPVMKKGPVPRRRKTSSVGMKKRKSSDIQVFDEHLDSSPATDNSGSSGPKRRKSSGKKSTPTAASKSAGSKRKSKATPVTVPVKSIMINVTNSAGSGNSDLSGTAVKKRSTKKKAAKQNEEEAGFDFSDSPVKPKAKASKGRSKKQAISLGGAQKAAPARKARVSVKAPATKANVKKTIRRKTQSPSTTSEASSRTSSARRGKRRSVRA